DTDKCDVKSIKINKSKHYIKYKVHCCPFFPEGIIRKRYCTSLCFYSYKEQDSQILQPAPLLHDVKKLLPSFHL
uniref:Uncharacterized protein n=1 Tax=Periophthalmus magnuspinnatus TaxID=409849 RepID=A0A3B4BD70_9GOBI